MHVLIYTLPNNTCPFCIKAKEFLADKNIPFDEVILETKEQRTAIKEKSGMKTAPVIYVDGSLVGGYDDMIRDLKEGKLVLNYR